MAKNKKIKKIKLIDHIDYIKTLVQSTFHIYAKHILQEVSKTTSFKSNC